MRERVRPLTESRGRRRTAEEASAQSIAEQVVEGGSIAHAREVGRRAFAEFLAFPTLIIGAFLVLAIGTFALDRSTPAWLGGIRGLLHVFLSAPGTTADLLGTIAGSLITVTSITTRTCIRA